MKTHHTFVLGSIFLMNLPALAVTTFTEDFTTGTSNWDGAIAGATNNVEGSTPINFNSTGGAPSFSSGFISSPFSFSDAGPFGATLFRAQNNIGSSNGAFEGDYLSSNVSEISLFIRHDAGVDISFNLRVASPANSPGFGILPAGNTLVATGVWTLLTFPIGLEESFIQQSGTPTTVLPNVGNLQLGATSPFSETDAGFNSTINFDLDAVTITTIPEPSITLIGCLGFVGLVRRQRR